MDQEPTRWNGQWWLAGDPQNRQPGILVRDQDEALRLELRVLNVMHQLGVSAERQMAVASDAELANLRMQLEVRSAVDGK